MTTALIAITVLAFLAQRTLGSNWFILQPAAVRAGDWWRLYTHTLGHGGLLHIGVNMYALYILGPSLEQRLGSARFLAVWVFSAISGGVAVTYLAHPYSQTVGASGAVFGLFGLWLGSAWVSRKTVHGNAQLRSILILLAINAGISLMPGISWQGHLGGLVAGVVAFGVFRVAKGKDWSTWLLLGLAAALVFATQL